MTAGPEAVLVARGVEVLHTSRGGSFRLAVEELSLRRGEVLAVIGPNGAGKSTLLRALAGLEAPRSGAIERRGVGAVTLVFQRPAALAGSVAHNARAGLLGGPLGRRASHARARAELERFGIAHLAARRAATLSGGELRRLALARAFALEPAALLLDEPYDDLDAAGQAALTRDLRRAIAQTGVAVAVVTHDLRRALLLADRIAVLIEGRLRQVGPRAEVLARPGDPEVARLVGMENRLPAEAEAGGTARVDDEHRVPLASVPPAGEVGWIGIRPEHLKLDVGRGEGEPIGKGVVESLVDDGIATHVAVHWAGHRLSTHLLAGRGLARTLSVGDPVSLSVRPERVHWMPASERADGGA